jgi:ankyrin repeat protein
MREESLRAHLGKIGLALACAAIYVPASLRAQTAKDLRTPLDKALVEAVKAGNTDLVKALSARGAHPDTRDWPACGSRRCGYGSGEEGDAIPATRKEAARETHDWTALMLAAQSGRTDIVRALLEKGASPEAGWRTGLEQDLQRMIAVNDPGAAAKRGNWTALLFAAEAGHADTVAVLLHYGANKDARTWSGQTALMLAVERGHLTVVNVLLKAGVQVNVHDETGQTALSLAKAHQAEAILMRLVLAGARGELLPVYDADIGHSGAQ